MPQQTPQSQPAPESETEPRQEPKFKPVVGGLAPVTQVNPHGNSQTAPTSISVGGPLHFQAPPFGSPPIQTEINGHEAMVVNAGSATGSNSWLPSTVIIPLGEGLDSSSDQTPGTKPADIPSVIVAPTPVPIGKNVIAFDVRLNLPFDTVAKMSTLDAQLFALFPDELADALDIPANRIRVAEVHKDTSNSAGDSIVTLAISPANGQNSPPVDLISKINEMLQDPNSAFFTTPNAAFTRLLDSKFSVTTSRAILSGAGEPETVLADEGTNMASVGVAIGLATVLYVALVGGFVYSFTQTRKEKLALMNESMPTLTRVG